LTESPKVVVIGDMGVESPDDPDLTRSRELAAKLAHVEWEVDEITWETEPPPEPDPPPRPPPPAPTPSLPSMKPSESTAEPLNPETILEAMLFVGGAPVTLAAIGQVIRGYTPEKAKETIDLLNRKYKAQNRPYAIQPHGDGYQLAVKPAYQGLRERLFGGPRETRLAQPALDVLSLIAYRQPIPKPELDALRGADCSAHLRQLVRLGLITVTERIDPPGYGTTPRFLELFQLSSLDDLPKLGETTSAY
jgi:segregation and condensation protein B